MPIHSNSLQFTPIHSNSFQFTPSHSNSLQFISIHSIRFACPHQPVQITLAISNQDVKQYVIFYTLYRVMLYATWVHFRAYFGSNLKGFWEPGGPGGAVLKLILGFPVAFQQEEGLRSFLLAFWGSIWRPT